MGTIIFALVLLVIVVACCIYAKNHKKESALIDDSTPPAMPDPSMYDKSVGRQRDAKGRFVKKTDSQ